jgi:hypothetical protein
LFDLIFEFRKMSGGNGFHTMMKDSSISCSRYPAETDSQISATAT